MGTRRDPKNPMTEQGKISYRHPDYYKTQEKARKQLEAMAKELGENRSGLKARATLEQTYLLLDSLEED